LVTVATDPPFWPGRTSPPPLMASGAVNLGLKMVLSIPLLPFSPKFSKIVSVHFLNYLIFFSDFDEN
jgi:hypothetical protein